MKLVTCGYWHVLIPVASSRRRELKPVHGGLFNGDAVVASSRRRELKPLAAGDGGDDVAGRLLTEA